MAIQVTGSPDPELIKQYYMRDPYREFLAREGIPIVEEYSVDCVNMPLEPWPRMGGLGAYVHLAGRGEFLSTYVSEIPPGGQLNVEQHLYDESIYVVKGRGATSIELPNGARHTFEWQEGSSIGIPLNAKHQHFNGSGSEPARFAAVTDLPVILNIFHNESFIFDNPYQFPERTGEASYFTGEGKFREVKAGQHMWETNLVPDLINFELPQWRERGAGGSMINFIFAESTLSAHISEFPPGTYKKAHRHDAGAHIFCVTGKGYSLLWLEGQDPTDTVRVDWWPGVLFAPPDGPTYHQHFNIAEGQSRYYVLGFGSRRYPVFDKRKAVVQAADMDIKKGGIQVEYHDEDHRILELYERECEKNGVASTMRDFLGGMGIHRPPRQP